MVSILEAEVYELSKNIEQWSLVRILLDIVSF